MKRVILIIITLSLLLITLATPALAKTNAATTVKGVRVVINGEVHTVTAKLYKNDWYLKSTDIKALLGEKATSASTLGVYANLRIAAKSINVNYEHDGVLKAAYIWTDEPYSSSASGSSDYVRAVSLGFADDSLLAKSNKTITPREFATILMTMIKKTVPTKLKQFKANVKPALSNGDPMLRGEGFVMAYYAAECLDADYRNNSFNHTVIPDDEFWNYDQCNLSKLFPHVWEGPVKWENQWNDQWENYLGAAFLWAAWYNSPSSGVQVFDYDENKNSMRPEEALTVQEALCAAVRIYDSYTLKKNNVSLSDSKAITYDDTILTKKLLDKAKALPEVSTEHLPTWRGFVLSNGGSYENTDIVETDQDLRNIANWGFSSVRLMITYQTLFSKDVKTVNLANLRKLDFMIASAIKYNLHVDLLLFSLPGRWTNIDFDTYETTASLDLFTNTDRQKEANSVWALLAERYRDIPSATLSFCPIWEAQNHSLSSGLPVPDYTDEDVARVYSQLVDTIRTKDPDRFIVFEPTAQNQASDIIQQSTNIKTNIQSKYANTLMMSNFCECPFVYAEMTAVAGAHIDHENHSMFKPAYPTTIYAAQYHLDKDVPMELSGSLKAGTSIEVYLSKTDGDGQFEIIADGKVLYEENLSTMDYNAQSPLSGYYPFAKSDKLISVKLPDDASNVSISYNGNWFEWSGINVTLPKKYAVQRWWFTSGYDAMLSGTKDTDPKLLETATIMISPNSYDQGREITINQDITYQSAYISSQSNKQTINDWAKTMAAYSPQLIVRFETADFSVGCIHTSALAYYNDLLATLNQYGFGWFSNDYYSLMRANYSKYAGIKTVQYKNITLDAEMLKLLQKYQ